MTVETWPISRLIPYERNARKITQKAIDKVARSLQEYGWRQPIVVDAHDVIIVGHVRRLAALQLGWTECPVHVADNLTPAQVRAYRLMDNRSNDEVEFDVDLLGLELGELKGLELDLSLTGFDSRELDVLLRTPDERADDAPPLPASPVTRPGDLWLMGEHRLLCGNCTDADSIGRVMDGKTASIVITDPPYGIGIVKAAGATVGGSKPFGSVGGGGKKGSQYPFGGVKNRATNGGAHIVKAREYDPVHGDDKPFDPIHLLTLAPEQIIFGANFFASKLPDGKSWITWDKDISGNFSACELAWTSRVGRLRMYRHMWSGLRREGPRNEELTERVHPTQKPVGLFCDIIRDFTERGDILIDPYLGSGSTLIAAEKEERSCYALEIDPRYCDVVVQRFITYSGKQATLENAHGATFEHVKEGRRLEGEDAIKEEIFTP